MPPGWLLGCALVLGCASRPAASPEAPVPASEAQPQQGALVVWIVVDQLPLALLERGRPHFSGGLARLTGPDAYQGVARYSHAITFTCPGHATLSTGASPSVHGIINNRWLTPEGSVYCADLDLLLAEPMADRVVSAGGRVLALSHKDRGAVMLGGRQGTVVYFDNDREAFIGAPWAAVDLAPHRATPWEPGDPELYATLGPDDRPEEVGCDGRATFPHAVDTAETFLCSGPAGPALVEVALAGLQAEGLGRAGTADLLTVSFSNTDYVGHAYGSESWEALDALLGVDQALGTLFDHLDAELPGRWTAVLSSDHGAAPTGGPRVDPGAVVASAQGALQSLSVGGEARFRDPDIRLPEVPEDRYAEVARAVADAVTEVEGIAAAHPWRVEGGLPDDAPHAEAVRQSVHPERSGDLYVLLEPQTLYLYKGDWRGTSHGTPYDYDQRVPLLMLGAGIAPGRADRDADVRQIAPTVAALLGVEPPSDAKLEPVKAALRQDGLAAPR